jgi:hypothetical protein
MKQLFLTATVALATLGANAQSVPDNHIAAPGERIGRVFIGDTRAAVGRRLGPATKAFNLGRGLTSQMWRSKRVGDTGGYNTLEVVYRNGLATQVEGTSLVWNTPSGLSLSSSRADWEDRLGAPTQTTYNYDSGARKRYLDWRRAGIALELVQDGDSESNEWTYQTLIVHRKGVAVIPDRGGTRE